MILNSLKVENTAAITPEPIFSYFNNFRSSQTPKFQDILALWQLPDHLPQSREILLFKPVYKHLSRGCSVARQQMTNDL